MKLSDTTTSAGITAPDLFMRLTRAASKKVSQEALRGQVLDTRNTNLADAFKNYGENASQLVSGLGDALRSTTETLQEDLAATQETEEG